MEQIFLVFFFTNRVRRWFVVGVHVVGMTTPAKVKKIRLTSVYIEYTFAGWLVTLSSKTRSGWRIDEARFLTSRSRFSSKPCRRRCESVGTVSTRCGKSRPDRSPPVEGNKRKNLKVTNVSIRVWNVRKKPLTSAISRASKLSLWKPGHTWNLPRNEFNFNNACVLVSSSSQDFTKIRSATVSFTRSNNPPTCSRHQHYLFRLRAMEEREIFAKRNERLIFFLFLPS